MSDAARTVDILVVGAGPAGVAAALVATRLGRHVALAHRPAIRTVEGQLMSAAGATVLRRLGVAHQDRPEALRECRSIASAWASHRVVHRDFVAEPGGVAWSVDRAAFDTLLHGSAHAAGIAIVPADGALRLVRRAGFWDVAVGGTALRAGFIIDATGRAAAVGRALGARRLRDDQQIALAATLAAAPEDGPGPLVEAVRDGWWYSVHRSDGALTVIRFTDADLARGDNDRTASGFLESLSRTSATRRRAVRDVAVVARPTVFAAHHARLSGVAGSGWLAAGDAALAHDPLSGHGITAALVLGAEAGEAASRWLGGATGSLAGYTARLAGRAAAYGAIRRDAYRAAARWRSEPYWRARI